jgi:hypothetical protein
MPAHASFLAASARAMVNVIQTKPTPHERLTGESPVRVEQFAEGSGSRLGCLTDIEGLVACPVHLARESCAFLVCCSLFIVPLALHSACIVSM